jgi:hypothetical protein
MKIIPAVIAVVFGGGFLAAEFCFNYYPPVPVISMSSFESPEQKKARAAVSALLLYPETASIDDLRTVKPDGGLYVCGRVNGKDRSGSYAGSREFLYEVAGDFAVIDHDEEIARSHRTFRPCPEEGKPKPFVVDLDKVNKIMKALPKPDVQIATSFPLPGGSGSARSPEGGQDLRQGIEGLKPNIQQNEPRQSSSTEGSTTEKSRGPVSPADEGEWRGDQPPKSWPRFSPDDPLSKPEAAFADSDALEFGSDIERRWKRFENGQSSSRPSVTEVEEALRALMKIKEQSPDYPRAWASFVRLRKIRRDSIALAQQTK